MEPLGRDDFLTVMAEYGKCLDSIIERLAKNNSAKAIKQEGSEAPTHIGNNWGGSNVRAT